MHDYLSVPLWVAYTRHVGELGDDDVDIARTRTLYQRAVETVGSHVAQGLALWERYIDYEEALSDDGPESVARCGGPCVVALTH